MGCGGAPLPASGLALPPALAEREAGLRRRRWSEAVPGRTSCQQLRRAWGDVGTRAPPSGEQIDLSHFRRCSGGKLAECRCGVRLVESLQPCQLRQIISFVFIGKLPLLP